MQELKVLKELVRVANRRGGFEIEESYNALHCLGVVEAAVGSLDPLKAELEAAKDRLKELEGNQKLAASMEVVDPVVIPSGPIKRPNHKQSPGPSKTAEKKETPKETKGA